MCLGACEGAACHCPESDSLEVVKVGKAIGNCCNHKLTVFSHTYYLTLSYRKAYARIRSPSEGQTLLEYPLKAAADGK
jgi:hypothetical protein